MHITSFDFADMINHKESVQDELNQKSVGLD
jgi:hypothetical protein